MSWTTAIPQQESADPYVAADPAQSAGYDGQNCFTYVADMGEWADLFNVPSYNEILKIQFCFKLSGRFNFQYHCDQIKMKLCKWLCYLETSKTQKVTLIIKPTWNIADDIKCTTLKQQNFKFWKLSHT